MSRIAKRGKRASGCAMLFDGDDDRLH